MKVINSDALVTVVVTTYNRPKLVRRAVKSVLSQTYVPMEVIIVEDGSDSGIVGWLKNQKLDDIRYIRHGKNEGLAAARNTGLQNAQGEYVAYLDDDDEWLSQKITKQVDLALKRARSYGVIYCGALVISSKENVIGKNRPRLRGDIRGAIREKGLFTIPSSCLFRKEALLRVGGYDENLSSHIDHDIWLKLAQARYAADFVSQCLVKAHKHQNDQMTTDAEARMQATRQFCSKWDPILTDWWTTAEAEKYCSKFLARVIGMLGWASVYAGDRKNALKYFLTAIYHYPANSRFYRGLVATIVGGDFYNHIVSMLKGCR
jgi:glycosyltransferase involved in cell wall biosynthesis